jgi:hypothetical protein
MHHLLPKCRRHAPIGGLGEVQDNEVTPLQRLRHGGERPFSKCGSTRSAVDWRKRGSGMTPEDIRRIKSHWKYLKKFLVGIAARLMRKSLELRNCTGRARACNPVVLSHSSAATMPCWVAWPFISPRFWVNRAYFERHDSIRRIAQLRLKCTAPLSAYKQVLQRFTRARSNCILTALKFDYTSLNLLSNLCNYLICKN